MTASVQGSAEGSAEEKVPDIEVILPEEGEITVGGKTAVVRRLRARQFFILMRVLTSGLGDGMARVRIDTEDQDQMASDLMVTFMVAVPNAIEEFGAFLASMVVAKDPADQDAVLEAMGDPEIETVLDVLGILIEQEKGDLQAIAGKAQAWIGKIQREGLPSMTG